MTYMCTLQAGCMTSAVLTATHCTCQVRWETSLQHINVRMVLHRMGVGGNIVITAEALEKVVRSSLNRCVLWRGGSGDGLGLCTTIPFR